MNDQTEPLPVKIAEQIPASHDDKKRILKEALKEALKEWLDEKYATVGVWTVRGFVATALAALLALVVKLGGAPEGILAEFFR